MKLLYITNGITGVGGLERVLSIKASHLADRLGYEVHIASLNEAGREPFYRFSPAITRHDIEKRRYFSGLRRLVRQLRPEVISVCDDGLKGLFVPLWIGHKGADGRRGPMIYERHVAKQIAPRGEWLMNFGARLYDRFVVLTEQHRHQWPRAKVHVIPNPLSFYPDTVSPLDQKRIVAVGKVSHQKGYDRLLEAWRRIAANHPGWRVDIFGTQTDGGELARAIEAEELSRATFRINAPSREIEREYLSSSIYALSSRYEGFGMVLTEAMACGVPCVAMDCPCGPGDIISNGKDGVLVPNGDIEGFAAALATLMDDAPLRRFMGREARSNVRRYNVEAVGAQWDQLFREL
jgi:glycosyltransferase involved in cell wall biosynthesis